MAGFFGCRKTNRKEATVSVRKDVIKWAKANKIAASIIAYLAVGFIVSILAIIIVFALPDSKPSTTSTETAQTDTVAEQPTETQPIQQTAPAPESQQSSEQSYVDSLTSTAVETCKKYTESQVYVAPASVEVVRIDEDTSDITVMALVKDSAGEYFAWCVLSPSGRTVKDFKVSG